jgi:hypothetical protein
MIALAVAHGLPEFLLLTIEALWCDRGGGDTTASTISDKVDASTDSSTRDNCALSIQLPDNYRHYSRQLLNTLMNARSARHSVDWLRTGITDNNAYVPATPSLSVWSIV